MITKTCLIFEGSPILLRDCDRRGSRVAALRPTQIFSARSQWLFWKTCFVIAAKVREFGTGTMLTVPRSWWVLRPVTPYRFRTNFRSWRAATVPSKGIRRLPVVPMPLSLATSSALSAVSSTTELGA